MIESLNFVNISCCACNDFEVLDIAGNMSRIIKQIRDGREKNVDIFVFPELCLTGCTCGDIFSQQFMYDSCIEAINSIASNVGLELVFIGSPLKVGYKVYNCVFVLHNHKVIGIVPKIYIKGDRELRWFSSGDDLNQQGIDISKYTDTNNITEIMGYAVPIGIDLVFSYAGIVNVAVDTGRGFYSSANIVVNCAADNETISKFDNRRYFVLTKSIEFNCVYAYCSAGCYESTTDFLYSGHRIIYENGNKLGERRLADNNAVIATVDLDTLSMSKLHSIDNDNKIRIVNFYAKDNKVLIKNIFRHMSKTPFVSEVQIDEVLLLQSQALAHRFKQTKSKHAVIGVSGGLDSTLALIATCKAFDILGKDREGIVGITMPSWGTTNKTYENANKLMSLLGVTSLECSIVGAMNIHFNDINQARNPDGTWKSDVTFENAQARERTQILMDYANKIGGLVVGTGDLSEIALGWCTYNGDHMSMYNVNAGVPKTLIQQVIVRYAHQLSKDDSSLADCLLSIVHTPISPELLPTNDDGTVKQLTEDSIGSYVLNDFFMYYLLKYGMSFEKVHYLSRLAFPDMDKKSLLDSLKNFILRFYSQQFKRSCMPDGVQICDISLSPREGWKCPSDISIEVISNFLDELDKKTFHFDVK